MSAEQHLRHIVTRPRLASWLLPLWLVDECEFHQSYLERAGALYDSWRAYAHERSAEPGSPAEFASAMEARGFTCDRLSRGDKTRIRWGIRLKCGAP